MPTTSPAGSRSDIGVKFTRSANTIEAESTWSAIEPVAAFNRSAIERGRMATRRASDLACSARSAVSASLRSFAKEASTVNAIAAVPIDVQRQHRGGEPHREIGVREERFPEDARDHEQDHERHEPAERLPHLDEHERAERRQAAPERDASGREEPADQHLSDRRREHHVEELRRPGRERKRPVRAKTTNEPTETAK